MTPKRVALVTGAGSGIGRAVALRLAREGMSVAVVDRRASEAQETVDRIAAATATATPVQVRAFVADVSKEQEVEKMIKEVVAAFGRLDVAVNNAGIEGERAPLHEMSVEAFDRVWQVNGRGVFLCMKGEIQQMLDQIANENPNVDSASSDGETSKANSQEMAHRSVAIDQVSYAIVNMSSTAGTAAMPEFSAYCASKHAIIGLTKSAAREYAPRGIRINAVLPGTTYTEMVERFEIQWPEWQQKQNETYPSGRITRAEEVADAVAWLCSETVSKSVIGHCLVVDGGGSV